MTPDFDTIDIQARNRLNRRLDDDARVPMAYRPLFRDIIATFRVPRRYKTSSATIKETINPSSSAIITAAILAVILFILMVVMPETQPWPALGLAVVAFLTGKSCGRVRLRESSTPVPDTRQDEIAAAEEAFYASLSPLIEMTRSDVHHRAALRWLQAEYSDSDSVRFRSSVESLIKGFGCTLAEYSDKDADAFEVSTSNIPDVRTTRHAILGPDGAIMVPGHVVFPQNVHN